MGGAANKMRLRLPLTCFSLQLLLIVLFALFVRYDEHTDAKEWPRLKALHNDTGDERNEFYFRYPSFQDVHVMIFVGFGFLMTFLKKYGYSSVAFNFLLAAFSLQWATLVQGWLHGLKEDGKIHIGIESMINADFCTGSVLISFGALLGKCSPGQLLVMTVFEAAFFPINEYILLSLLQIKDAGGSMTIHAFGAYFGLTVTRMLYRPQLEKSRHREGPVYHSNLFAMIGTIYLWMFWPSFNSAVTSLGSGQHRTALNTYYSLAACTLATFATSSVVHGEGKLDMVHIQNAALAGGVAVGTAGEMMLSPYGSMIVGFLSGIISTLGFQYLTGSVMGLTAQLPLSGTSILFPGGSQELARNLGRGYRTNDSGLSPSISAFSSKPILESKLKIQDTCGVHNLHGMPGILGGVVGAITASLATEEVYGEGLQDVFPLLGDERTASQQGLYQALGLAVTLAFALVGGAIVGFIMKLPVWGAPPDTQCFTDQPYWELPEDESGYGEMAPVKVEEVEKMA